MRAKTEVILERYPYRFVQKGLLEENGAPDFRIQKFNDIQKRYYDMYYLDSQAQLDCCIEDPEYVKWLDQIPLQSHHIHYQIHLFYLAHHKMK